MQAAQEPSKQVKVVLVGDGGCGKTSLLTVFAEGYFPETYTPTVFERLSVKLQVKGKTVQLQIWDTAGQVDYDRLRPLFYPDAGVLLLCFDVTSPYSFDNVLNRLTQTDRALLCRPWPAPLPNQAEDPSVAKPHLPPSPAVVPGGEPLLQGRAHHARGLQDRPAYGQVTVKQASEDAAGASDLQQGREPALGEGQEMARSVGAVAYLECSALLQENVQAVFQQAAKVALSSRGQNIWRRITRSFCVIT
ncbi:rho-related GTP-binding protein RhoD isoform X1 [Erinaceus europaeus]|uniref:Rho-related GTP-binding protein RhoD isoform X1 n=1 Tax=Erinaceus europaeus TaxID=9365 RepID=A0ABM3WTD8_ERIEU|nr:rho-related GTP-binding protein RhoD isoform X1 [Erinaceus europaeus]